MVRWMAAVSPPRPERSLRRVIIATPHEGRLDLGAGGIVRNEKRMLQESRRL